MWASQYDHGTMVTLLLDKGAKVNISDKVNTLYGWVDKEEERVEDGKGGKGRKGGGLLHLSCDGI